MPKHTAGVYRAAVAIVALTSLTLSGCSSSGTKSSDPEPVGMELSGVLHGGQQPVTGAAIQLYAANSSVFQGPSTPLLATTVVSGAGGSFTITGDYTCPASDALVYLVAVGGNPGLSGSGNNAGLALMAALGPCGTLASSTFISVNELTTVASTESLAPFMTDITHVGSAAANASALASAFGASISLVDPATGTITSTAPNGSRSRPH